MYIPKHFEETDVTVLHGAIRRHPLGGLVTLTPDGPEANHIPFLIHPDPAPYGTLHGHVARANPVWRESRRDIDVLVIFQGDERYISPSWYPTKHDTQKVVPTWNYVIVHARGPLHIIDDVAWIRPHLEALTREHESERPAPWALTDAPADYIDTMMKAIVGIEIPIAQLSGKWKVSQNRSERDRRGVIDGLAREGSPAATSMAGLVKKTLES
jgi:transcriptional regulator